MVKSLRSLFISLSAILLILAGCGDDEASVVDSSLVDSSLTVVVTTNILGDVVERLVGDQLVVETIMPVGADPHLFQASAKQVNQMMSASVVVANGADFEEGLIDILSTIEGDGVAIFEAMSSVQALEFGSDDDDHDDHADHDDHDDDKDHADHDDHDDDKDHADHDDHDDHDDDKDHADHDDHDDHDDDKDHADHDDHDDDKDHADHDDHAGHDHSGLDPHFFTDPIQMIEVVE
ncbi:MAG: zinc ABC transporter substrate-binding protein, partial [Actinomycetota bacterium]|nr:zinc ABC transporter substrate-binding protein [Actinomycetota bacterium]